jgi:hypothetical protein
MDFKKEINSKFLGDRSRVDYLAELMTKRTDNFYKEYLLLYNTVMVMQEAIVKIEDEIQSLKNDIEAIGRKL